jgi:hypothetical protein
MKTVHYSLIRCRNASFILLETSISEPSLIITVPWGFIQGLLYRIRNVRKKNRCNNGKKEKWKRKKEGS